MPSDPPTVASIPFYCSAMSRVTQSMQLWHMDTLLHLRLRYWRRPHRHGHSELGKHLYSPYCVHVQYTNSPPLPLAKLYANEDVHSVFCSMTCISARHHDKAKHRALISAALLMIICLQWIKVKSRSAYYTNKRKACCKVVSSVYVWHACLLHYQRMSESVPCRKRQTGSWAQPPHKDKELKMGGSVNAQAMEAWTYAHSRCSSAIVDIFTGHLQSTLQRPVREACSRTFDDLMNISVPLPCK